MEKGTRSVKASVSRGRPNLMTRTTGGLQPGAFARKHKGVKSTSRRRRTQECHRRSREQGEKLQCVLKPLFVLGWNGVGTKQVAPKPSRIPATFGKVFDTYTSILSEEGIVVERAGQRRGPQTVAARLISTSKSGRSTVLVALKPKNTQSRAASAGQPATRGQNNRRGNKPRPRTALISPRRHCDKFTT